MSEAEGAGGAGGMVIRRIVYETDAREILGRRPLLRDIINLADQILEALEEGTGRRFSIRVEEDSITLCDGQTTVKVFTDGLVRAIIRAHPTLMRRDEHYREAETRYLRAAIRALREALGGRLQPVFIEEARAARKCGDSGRQMWPC